LLKPNAELIPDITLRAQAVGSMTEPKTGMAERVEAALEAMDKLVDMGLSDEYSASLDMLLFLLTMVLTLVDFLVVGNSLDDCGTKGEANSTSFQEP
jgi:hypothetical protein